MILTLTLAWNAPLRHSCTTLLEDARVGQSCLTCLPDKQLMDTQERQILLLQREHMSNQALNNVAK